MPTPAVYCELEGWPKELIDDNITGTKGTFQPVRKLVCAWADRYQLVSDLWYTYYPYVTSSLAVATKFSMEPFPKIRIGASGGNTALSTYDKALVTVYYTSDRYASGKTYWMEELIPEAGYDARLSESNLYWQSNPVQLDQAEAPVLSCPSLRYMLTYYQLGVIPSTWVAYQNYVNDGNFYTKSLGGLYFPSNTVKYEGVKLSHKMNYAGATLYTAQLSFNFKNNDGYGWHGAWNSNKGASGGWDYITQGSGGPIVYLYPRIAFAF